jgi:hypothetical protein
MKLVCITTDGAATMTVPDKNSEFLCSVIYHYCAKEALSTETLAVTYVMKLV